MLYVVAALAGGYALVCLLAVCFQERLVFYPTRMIGRTPAAAGLAHEDVTFTREDGTELNGWFVPGGPVTVLVCHGNAGNVGDRVETLAILASLDLSVLIFDYAGYGRSQGRPTERGTYDDAAAARRWLVETRGVDPSRLVYFGRSLGGAVAIGLAEREPPAALVVEATFSTLPDLGAIVYPWLPVKLLSRVRYDSVRRVRTLDCPKLIMHSREDETVPFELARRLFAAAAEPKWFVELSGGHSSGHLDSGRSYVDAWAQFLDDAGITRRRS